MKKVEIQWKKLKTVITQEAFECECGNLMRQVAFIGCIHEDGTSYLFQCVACKTIGQSDYVPHNSGENFIGAGYKKVEESTP